MSTRNDADTFFIGERLTALTSRIYEQKLPPLNADLLLSPTGGENLGANQIERAVYESTGKAEVVNDYGHDLPRVNAAVIRGLHPIIMGGVSFGYNLKEIRAAQFSNMPLEERRARAARRAVEEFRNAVFFQGNRDKQVYGLANFPLVPRVLLNEADFADASDPDDFLKALYSMGIFINESTNGAEEPTHLLVDDTTYNAMASRRVGTDNNDTILEVYKRNAPYAKEVVRVREFRKASPTGGRMIMAVTLGGDNAEHIVPDPMTILDPQHRSLDSVVPVVCETAGFITEYPRAHAMGYIN